VKANYLVCYDIREERRLSRVYRFMRGKGLHLQYSVFYCRLTWQELLTLKGGLSEIIEESEDDVRIYPLPGDLKASVLGRGAKIPDGVEVFLT
jgi:CRISPR-associated protein Cas2